jgi:SAM-dependent methyltransferase
MSAQDRVRWDAIYRERSHQPYPSPDPLLFDFTPPVPASAEKRALDLAAGLGQNGLWLAAQGYTVDIMEISRVALSRARREMAIRNLRNINLLQTDLDELFLDEQQYDLICVFRYLSRDLNHKIAATVAPGGRIIYETFNIHYLDIVPGFNTHFLVMPGEMKEFFPGFKIIHESDVAHISQVVALKPAIPG